MTAVRILHVDDEPDIREVVRISLELDPEIMVRSCASGTEALAAAGDWRPDLVLLDVMMPSMDGPTTLARLREGHGTAAIPVVFMTARVQTRELDHFRSLGAAGVIAKPFDPATLAGEVRKFVRRKPPGLEIMQEEFFGRARRDANELAGCRKALASGRKREDVLQRARVIAHGLAGAGGIFGYREISADAAALEEALIAERAVADIQTAIDTLLASISATVGERPEAAVAGAGDKGAFPDSSPGMSP